MCCATDSPGAVTITASHNPPEYNGVKFTPAWGGPALLEATRAIEAAIDTLSQGPESGMAMPGASSRAQRDNSAPDLVDLRPDYLNGVARLLDFDAIRGRESSIVVDHLYGAARATSTRFSCVQARASRCCTTFAIRTSAGDARTPTRPGFVSWQWQCRGAMPLSGSRLMEMPTGLASSTATGRSSDRTSCLHFCWTTSRHRAAGVEAWPARLQRRTSSTPSRQRTA